MPKKTATPEARTETSPEEAAATTSEATTAPLSHVVAGGLPRFNFSARPTTEEGMTSEATGPIRQSYESVQSEAKGPGVEEWRQVDKARSDLAELYNNLREDDRYAPEYKAESAWAKYEETRAQVEKLAPEARAKMLRSAGGLERMSIPTPESEGLITKDTNKLLLTAHERSRLEGLVNRADKSAKGPFKANPLAILKAEYERGLEQGGPGGGSTVRAVYELARDWGLDIDAIVDAHRKSHHRGALEDAQSARMRAEMIGRTVPQPPFAKGGVASKGAGTYGTGATTAFIPREKGMLFKNKNRRPAWR